MKMLIGVMVLMAWLTTEADAGIFRRRPRPSRASGVVHFDNIPVVDELPSNGATRIKDGWHWEWHSTGSHSGVWVGTHPVGADPRDYRDGYPKHGATRFKNGLNWTYDARTNTWISEWH